MDWQMKTAATEEGGDPELTGCLEDYLETIYELVSEKQFARIKDIAHARDVKSGSVTGAMRRLEKLGYIKYERREYIVLTPEGEQVARRINARHQVLTQFFSEVLQIPEPVATENACAMEHSLTNEGMDRLVRFLEFIRICPAGHALLEKFHHCSMVHPQEPSCDLECEYKRMGSHPRHRPIRSVADLKPGQAGRVAQVKGQGAIRQRLLDMGILPDTEVFIERVAPAGDPIWIKIHGFQLSLRRKEAEAVRIHD